MTISKTGRLSTIAVAVAAATSLTGFSALAAQSQSLNSQLNVVQKAPAKAQNKQAVREASERKQAFTRFIVEFEQAPVATYRGGVAGLAATSAKATGAERLDAKSNAAQAYTDYLLASQAQTLAAMGRAAPGLNTQQQLTLTFNGAIVKYSGNKSATEFKREILALPGVKAVYDDAEYYVNMDASNDLINSTEAWAVLGGQDSAGNGVKVAVIDTGIDFAHPMFSDNGHDVPAVGVTDDYCATTPDVCNDKLAVARFFPAPSSVHPDEHIDSPRDYNGHGSHVAGTAVGNPVSANYDGIALNFSGVAPGANLMVYKALYTNTSGNGSGMSSSLAAALEAAAADGADVINNSWGGGAGGSPSSSPYRTIMESLDEMGVVTVTSAGNSGPGANTVGCPGCIEETITVASTQTGRMFVNELEVTGFDGIEAQLGNGDFSVTAPITADLLPASQVDALNVEACTEFAADAFAGHIALVTRGTCSFEQKANTVQAAGAVGMVLYNNAEGSLLMGLGAATLPSVSISQADGEAIEAAYDVGMQATINPNTMTMVDANVDIMSDFSSRGPNGDPSMLKPEIAAPGHDILSAAPGQGFAIMSGTSMAGPHVAGAAALVLAHNPELAPQQVKSVLMTSAKGGIKKHDGETAADAFDVGAGRLDMATAVNTGLTFDVASFANPMCVNTCTFERTVTSLASESTEWAASATFANSNITATFADTLSLDANGTADFSVEVNGSMATEGWQFGTLTLTDTSGSYADVNLPIAVYTALSTDSGVLSGGITEGEAIAGADMVTTVMSNMGHTGEEVTLTAQYPTDESFVLAADAIEVIETGSAATSSEFDETTRTFTWVGSQTDVAGEVTFTDATATFPYAGLSFADLAAAGDGFEFLSVCHDEACDEQPVSLDISDIPDLAWQFDGVDHTTFVMWENGLVELDNNVAGYTFITQDLPNPNTPNNIIAAFWNDYVINANDGAMHYALFDDGDAIWLALEWNNVRKWTSTGDPNATPYTFSLWFEMNTGNAYVSLLDVNQGDVGWGTIMGMENVDGSQGGSESYSASNAPADGTVTMMTYANGVNASVQVNATAHVTDFGAIAGASGEGLHGSDIAIDTTAAVGSPSRSFTTLMAAESGSETAEAVLPIAIAPQGSLHGEVVEAPANGTVSFAGLVATYTANAGFVGDDSFSYRAVDENGSVSATNTITVTVTNTAPTVSVEAVAQAEAGDTVELTATATDADEDTLSYAWAQTAGAEVDLTGVDTAVASFVVPELSEDSDATFVLTVSDGAAEVEHDVTLTLVAAETEAPTPAPGGGSSSSSSSSSFGWLFTLLALPLVWLRRRMV